jgi:hypothetical protein
MSFSSRRIALAVATTAIAACSLMPLSSPSRAATARKECSAVLNSAEVVADESIIVTLIAHKGKKVCIFYISPPAHTTPDPISVATSYANSFDGEPPPFVQAAIDNVGFVELLTDALLKPLQDESVTKDIADDAAALSKVIKEGSDGLRQCSLEAFSNGAKFSPIDSGVSCGLDTGTGRQLVVEASLGGLSVELFLPLKSHT